MNIVYYYRSFTNNKSFKKFNDYQIQAIDKKLKSNITLQPWPDYERELARFICDQPENYWKRLYSANDFLEVINEVKDRFENETYLFKYTCDCFTFKGRTQLTHCPGCGKLFEIEILKRRN